MPGAGEALPGGGDPGGLAVPDGAQQELQQDPTLPLQRPQVPGAALGGGGGSGALDAPRGEEQEEEEGGQRRVAPLGPWHRWGEKQGW